MAQGGDRDYPMVVHVTDAATVEELIGFIAWKYTENRRVPALKPHTDSYSLYMGEFRNGTVEALKNVLRRLNYFFHFNKKSVDERVIDWGCFPFSARLRRNTT